MADLLQEIRDSLFPATASPAQSPWSRVADFLQRRVFTKARTTLTTLRHPAHQGGLTVTEDGETSLRAGHDLYDHAVGASLSLLQDGHAVLSAPAGFVVSGKQYNAASPTRALAFYGGRLQFHPRWESEDMVVLVVPQTALTGLFVAPAAGAPATVPLSQVFSAESLYRKGNPDVPQTP